MARKRKADELATTQAQTVQQKSARTRATRSVSHAAASTSTSAQAVNAYATASTTSKALTPSPSTPKRQRKKKSPDASSPEKRDAIFKKSCPKTILDRVGRVFSQRFFMIDRRRTGQLKEEFSVLGSTGNVYTVVIDKRPACNCPDHLKGNHCKHILFIFLKVLQVPQHTTYWYQKALLTEELEVIFRDAPPPPNVIAAEHVREAYARATGKSPSADEGSGSKPTNRVPGKDDDCPICYETMYEVKEADLNYCSTCHNALHKVCFQQWAKSASTLTCVYCRAIWASEGPSRGKKKAFSEEGYVNLGVVAGLSPMRDTSTYHQGWRYQ